MVEQIFPLWSVNVARLNSVFSLKKVDQKHYNGSIKSMESTSCPMRFLGFSSQEKGAPTQETRLFHYPTEACGKLQHVFEN